MTLRGLILQVLACCELLPLRVLWIGAGVWFRANSFMVCFFCCFLCSYAPNSTSVVLLLVFKLVEFYGNLNWDFHGHVEPCRTCRLYSDIVLVVYIYICMIIYVVFQLILVLQVAVVCLLCVCSVLFLWLVSVLD